MLVFHVIYMIILSIAYMFLVGFAVFFMWKGLILKAILMLVCAILTKLEHDGTKENIRVLSEE